MSVSDTEAFKIGIAAGLDAAGQKVRLHGYHAAADILSRYSSEWQDRVLRAHRIPRVMVSGDIYCPTAARWACAADFGLDA